MDGDDDANFRLDIGFQDDKQQQDIVMHKLKNNSRPIIGNSKEFSNKVHPGPDNCLLKPSNESLIQDTELGPISLSSPSCIVDQPLSTHDSLHRNSDGFITSLTEVSPSVRFSRELDENLQPEDFKAAGGWIAGTEVTGNNSADAFRSC